MEKINTEILKNSFDVISKSITLCAFPYIFVISNDKYIRDYFIERISYLKNVSVIDESKANSEIELKDKLEVGNILLLNTDKKDNEIRNLINKDENYNALYYRLVFLREYLWKNKKTIIIVCDEKTIEPLLHENQSLASTSSFHFIDDQIKEKKLTKKGN